MNRIKFYWNIISPFIVMVLTGVIVFFVIGLALSIPLCLLWNWLMPLFGLPQVTIWQALGLLFLCNILFGQKQYNMENLKNQFKKVTKRDILND